MKIFTLLIIAIFTFFSVYSQENKNDKSSKVFHAFGYAFLVDYVSSPVKAVPYQSYDYNTNQPVESHSFLKTDGINLASCIYRFRYNLFEPSPENAVSLSLTPAVGFGLVIPTGGGGGEGGFFTFNLPLMLNYEHGAGSTYKSSFEHGVFLGAGIEYFRAPVISVEKQDEKPITDFIMPTVATGFRYWTRNNRLMEVNLKFGHSLNKLKLPSVYQPDKLPGALSAYSFRISLILFLNY